jgi:hypothetical protein
MNSAVEQTKKARQKKEKEGKEALPTKSIMSYFKKTDDFSKTQKKP